MSLVCTMRSDVALSTGARTKRLHVRGKDKDRPRQRQGRQGHRTVREHRDNGSMVEKCAGYVDTQLGPKSHLNEEVEAKAKAPPPKIPRGYLQTKGTKPQRIRKIFAADCHYDTDR